MIIDPFIENNFEYHPPRNAETAKAHEELRAKCKALAYDIKRLVPAGREWAVAMTHLETVMMWGNAGIARN